MISSMRIVAAALSILLLCSGGTQAQTRKVAQAKQIVPCALVCTPPATLNAEKCSCEESKSQGPHTCALVCLNPDETLDAKACRCVKK
jgi:hypothetical protein